MNIAVIGTGGVGQTIASALTKSSHTVMIGTRNVAEKLASKSQDSYGNPTFAEWYKGNSNIKLGTFSEAASFGQIIVHATKGDNAVSALQQAGSDNLRGKILLDISNPLDFSKGMPPVLIPALSNDHSLGEEIQKTFPDVKVVKTLNTMWAGLMVNPRLINGDHVNFICGNDKGAKEKVKSLLKEFGWEEENILDLGDISSSRGTEAYLPIWLRIMNAGQSAAFNINIVR